MVGYANANATTAKGTALAYQMMQALVCDGCLRYERISADRVEDLPAGWRLIALPGWVGDFHVCSDRCVQLLKDRVQPTHYEQG